MNTTLISHLRCGTWVVAQVRAPPISQTRTFGGSLRILQTPSMAEAHHVAHQWNAGDYSREAGSVRRFNEPTPKKEPT